MGLESRCAVRVEDGSGLREDADAKIELEGDALVVRGPARVRVARSDITALEAVSYTHLTLPTKRIV